VVLCDGYELRVRRGWQEERKELRKGRRDKENEMKGRAE
jgi:hypothetical protein